MDIAVLGWGSLIWNPRELKIKSKSWKPDGPFLPIEFARISTGNRLTLVLYPGTKKVPTLWNLMNVHTLEEALENLRSREGTPNKRNIGFIDLDTGESNCNAVPSVKDVIWEWAREKQLNAVIWTDLASNFLEKTGMEFNKENVQKYLETLNNDARKLTEEYVRKAPLQIKTALRAAIEHYLGVIDNG